MSDKTDSQQAKILHLYSYSLVPSLFGTKQTGLNQKWHMFFCGSSSLVDRRANQYESITVKQRLHVICNCFRNIKSLSPSNKDSMSLHCRWCNLVCALAAIKSLSLLNNDSTSSHLNQCIMLALVLPNVPEVLKIV